MTGLPEHVQKTLLSMADRTLGDHKARRTVVYGYKIRVRFDPLDGIVDIEILVKDNKEETA